MEESFSRVNMLENDALQWDLTIWCWLKSLSLLSQLDASGSLGNIRKIITKFSCCETLNWLATA
jgi:hypothetical protein